MDLRPLALDAMLNAAVAEILALLCENSDPFFFSRDFKRYTGLAPKNYRNQHIREI